MRGGNREGTRPNTLVAQVGFPESPFLLPAILNLKKSTMPLKRGCTLPISQWELKFMLSPVLQDSPKKSGVGLGHADTISFVT